MIMCIRPLLDYIPLADLHKPRVFGKLNHQVRPIPAVLPGSEYL
jgi:hypothetical protein